MRTGWSANPISINDRDQSLNNILFEADIISLAQSNAPDDQYGLITEALKTVRVPEKYHLRMGEV